MLCCVMLDCVAWNCMALPCVASHCIAFYCIALHFVASHSIILHRIASYCIVLRCFALFCIVLHRIASCCIALSLSHHITSHHIARRHITSHRSTSRHIWSSTQYYHFLEHTIVIIIILSVLVCWSELHKEGHRTTLHRLLLLGIPMFQHYALCPVVLCPYLCTLTHHHHHHLLQHLQRTCVLDTQKCTSKGKIRQGIVLNHRKSLQKSLCPVVICLYLCSSETRSSLRQTSRGPQRHAQPEAGHHIYIYIYIYICVTHE